VSSIIITIVFNTETRETNFSITQTGDAQPNLANLVLALAGVQQQAAASALAAIKQQQTEGRKEGPEGGSGDG